MWFTGVRQGFIFERERSPWLSITRFWLCSSITLSLVMKLFWKWIEGLGYSKVRAENDTINASWSVFVLKTKGILRIEATQVASKRRCTYEARVVTTFKTGATCSELSYFFIVKVSLLLLRISKTWPLSYQHFTGSGHLWSCLADPWTFFNPCLSKCQRVLLDPVYGLSAEKKVAFHWHWCCAIAPCMQRVRMRPRRASLPSKYHFASILRSPPLRCLLCCFWISSPF